MYTIVDIMDKLIEIEENLLNFYKQLQMDMKIEERVKLAAGVLAREERRHIITYKGIKKEISNFKDIEIDFDIYDSASKIILEFKRGLIYSEVSDVKKLLSCALDFEHRNIALIIRIQGLLVRSMEDTQTNSYKALTKIIHEEEQHVNMIKIFLR
ncbi:MAG: hypothetical protein WDA24_09180 [Tissierellales bacterium]